ncbi:MAG: signal transduction protein [Pseudomonadota bacterium]
MKHHKMLSAFALATLLISACANGPDRRPPRGGDRGGEQSSFEGYAAKPVTLLFVSMDQNNDARISSDELLRGIDREWDLLTSRHPIGALEYGEWSAATLGSSDALPSFISFDRDLDGSLSELEFGDRLRAEFADLDKNSDGLLDRSELIFRISRPARQQQGGQQGRGGQEGRRPPPR